MLYFEFILNSYVAYLTSGEYDKKYALELYEEIVKNIQDNNEVRALKKLDYLEDLNKIKETFIK